MYDVTLEDLSMCSVAYHSGLGHKIEKDTGCRGDEILCHPLDERGTTQENIDIWLPKTDIVRV